MSGKKAEMIPVIKQGKSRKRHNRESSEHSGTDSSEHSDRGHGKCHPKREHHNREKRCFGNCCAEAAIAYGRFYKELGERSLESIESVKLAHPDFYNYTFTAIRATVFGGISGFPSIHPAVRGALAAVAQSCSNKCCCEVVDTIVNTGLGYSNLALFTVLTIPDDSGQLTRLALGTTLGSPELFGIIPPDIQIPEQREDVGFVVPADDNKLNIVDISPGPRELGLLIASFINTLRIALDSFCPKALKLYDSWELFVPGVPPVPSLPPKPPVNPVKPVTPPASPPVSTDERIAEVVKEKVTQRYLQLNKR